MNHIYKCFLLTVATLSAIMQSYAAIPGHDITIHVDDPLRVKVEFCEYSTVKQTVDFAGGNQVSLEWPYGLKLRVSALDGNILQSVTLGDEDKFVTSMLQCTIDFDRNNSDGVVDVVSAPLNRSVSFTVNVDKPEKLKMFNDNTMRDRDNQVYFTESANVFSVDPDVELPVKFNGNSWKDNILKATLNGEDITNPSDSYYELSPSDGDVIAFYFEAPQEQKFNIAFDYGTGAQGIVKSVKVNNVEKDDFDGSDFQVDAGVSLKVYIDTENYDIASVTRNGEPVRWSNQEIYLDAVREDLTFKFDAHRLGKVKLNINVDNAAGVQVFNSSYNNHKPLELIDGDNEVEVDETVSQYLCIISHPDYRLLSVDINGDPMDREYINYYKYRAGDRLVIATEQLVRDRQAVVYADKPGNMYVFRDNESQLQLQPGYNIVSFSEYDSPFMVYHPVYAAVNGRRIYSESEDDYIYRVGLADGDVFKMYLADAPVLHAVAFDVSGDPGRFAVFKDFYTPMQPFDVSVEHGARLIVCPVGDNVIEVEANGVSVAPGTDQQVEGCHVDVLADTVLGITVIENAISQIAAGLDMHPADIYGLDGVVVKRAATRADLDNLAPGFYIVGSHKLLK